MNPELKAPNLNFIQTELKWAFSFCLLSLIWFLLENVSRLQHFFATNSLLVHFLFAAPVFLIYFFAFLEKNQELGRYSNFRKLFYSGIKLTGWACLSFTFVPLTGMSFIDPDFFRYLTHRIPFQSAYNQQMHSEWFTDLFQLIDSTFLIAILGILFSLLFSQILSRKRSKKSSGRDFDIFFSFSKMDLGEGMPDDKLLYDNLFHQIRKADQLGFRRAWIGEAHFSIKTEQKKPEPLLPHFNGELCINTDILQIASRSYYQTEQIEIGSAIRNILVNGGPISHAEAIRTFLTIHGEALKNSNRKLQIGFGVGRFAYANEVYGIKPRNEAESILWPALRGLILKQATEIFLRMLKGETLGSADISASILKKEAMRNPEHWLQAMSKLNRNPETSQIIIPPFWEFQTIKLIPEDCDLSNLELTLGSHDEELQVFANQFLPVKVFNLSVTPGEVVDKTHERMVAHYHPDGGFWKREYMPRTIMIFANADKGLTTEEQDLQGFEEAKAAMTAYWKAMEGTVDQAKVSGGMENAVYGSPEKVKRMLDEKFHPQDRLMTWFDFNTNDANVVMNRMNTFMEHVKPLFDEKA